MAERLTRNNKVNFYFHDEASNMVYYKLQYLEDIMEKYGIESVEKLSNALEFAKVIENILSEYGIKDNEELDKKLADFDNFMKGNKFETIEDLQNALNGKFIEVFDEKNKIWQDMIKNLTKTEKERDTWERACELASETLKQVMGKPLWIGGNIPTPEVKDSDYFYQQAKQVISKLPASEKGKG